MYRDSDEDLFLAPEAMVSLPFDLASEDDSDWDIDYGDLRAYVERIVESHSAVLSSQFLGDLLASDTESEGSDA